LETSEIERNKLFSSFLQLFSSSPLIHFFYIPFLGLWLINASLLEYKGGGEGRKRDKRKKVKEMNENECQWKLKMTGRI
jgi:hypothetical protein